MDYEGLIMDRGRQELTGVKAQVCGQHKTVEEEIGTMISVVGWTVASLRLMTGTSWCQNYFPGGVRIARTQRRETSAVNPDQGKEKEEQ